MIKKLVFLITLGLTACSSNSSEAPPAKPLVWVSIAPYQDLTQRIAGSSITVETIVPIGSNPHSFEPTSRQAGSLGQGRVWLRIGEPFENKLLSLLQSRNPNLLVHDLRKGIELIEEEGSHCHHCGVDHQDRHIWMSPKETQTQANHIAATLAIAFPELKEDIEKNTQTLIADLQALDTQIESLLKPVVNRAILVSHPAFAYFCRDYHCEQLSVEYEGKEPRPRQVEALVQRAAESKTGMAITLPQYNNKGAQLIAKKLHLPVQMVDPYSPDYFGTLLKIAQLIADPSLKEISSP